MVSVYYIKYWCTNLDTFCSKINILSMRKSIQTAQKLLVPFNKANLWHFQSKPHFRTWKDHIGTLYVNLYVILRFIHVNKTISLAYIYIQLFAIEIGATLAVYRAGGLNTCHIKNVSMLFMLIQFFHFINKALNFVIQDFLVA